MIGLASACASFYARGLEGKSRQHQYQCDGKQRGKNGLPVKVRGSAAQQGSEGG